MLMNDVVASDLEGTLTTGETWRILGRFLKANGRAAQYNAFFYTRLPGVLLTRVKLINAQRFREQWFAGMTALLKGMRREQIDALMAKIVEEMWAARRQDVLAELEQHRQKHRQNGARILIASGTYQQAADAFAARIGADAIATELEVNTNGEATGRLIGSVSTGETKASRVRERLQGGTLIAAYGDTEGDIPMLSMAQQAVAVYPDATLRAKALASGWRILDS
jgi:phosphoserine phosphatase